MCKTTRAGFERLRARVVELHPYEVPEVVALPIEAGARALSGVDHGFGRLKGEARNRRRRLRWRTGAAAACGVSRRVTPSVIVTCFGADIEACRLPLPTIHSSPPATVRGAAWTESTTAEGAERVQGGQ